MMRRVQCPDCDVSRAAHVGDWIDALLARLAHPAAGIAARFAPQLSALIEWLVLSTGLMRRVWDADIPRDQLVARDRLVVEACTRAGIPVYVLVGPAGATTHIGARIGSTTIRFDGLPSYEDLGCAPSRITNSKTQMKERLRALGAPVAESRTFWFWQSVAAERYAKTLGRIVVKPDAGTMDRHVSVDVTTETFAEAFAKARRFGPRIIVETYVPHTVMRITVIGGRDVFALRYEAPGVVGDGVHTVRALIELENSNPRRKPMTDSHASVHHIALDDETEKYVAAQNMTLQSVPDAGMRVSVRRDPFVRHGSTFTDVTKLVHPDFRALAVSIAEGLNAFAAGIDCIVEDFSRAPSQQTCVVLEVNPVPFIELHATSDRPTEIGDAVVQALVRVASMGRR